MRIYQVIIVLLLASCKPQAGISKMETTVQYFPINKTKYVHDSAIADSLLSEIKLLKKENHLLRVEIDKLKKINALLKIKAEITKIK